MQTYLVPVSVANAHANRPAVDTNRHNPQSGRVQAVDEQARGVLCFSTPVLTATNWETNPFIEMRPFVKRVPNGDDSNDGIEMDCLIEVEECFNPLLDGLESALSSTQDVLRPLLPTHRESFSTKRKVLPEIPPFYRLTPATFTYLFGCLGKEQFYPLLLTSKFFRVNPQLKELFKREKSHLFVEYARKLCGVETQEAASRREWNHFQIMVMQSAARNGHLKLMQYYVETLKYPLNQLVRKDGVYLPSLSDHYCHLDSIDLYAADGGHVEVLQWLHDRGCSLNRKLLEAASATGRIPVLQWLLTKGYKLKDNDDREWHNYCYHYASEGGHLETLNWLGKEGCPLFERPEDPDIVRWGRLFPRSWLSSPSSGNYTTCRIAKKGHLDVLKWLHKRKFEFHKETMNSAVVGGHLATIQWLNKHREELKLGPLDKYTMREAAINGHLDVIQWLRNKECPWDGNATAYAASHCHLEVLAWLLDNGCPWDAHIWRCRCCREEGKYLPVYAFLKERGLVPYTSALELRVNALSDRMHTFLLHMQLRGGHWVILSAPTPTIY